MARGALLGLLLLAGCGRYLELESTLEVQGVAVRVTLAFDADRVSDTQALRVLESGVRRDLERLRREDGRAFDALRVRGRLKPHFEGRHERVERIVEGIEHTELTSRLVVYADGVWECTYFYHADGSYTGSVCRG